MSNTTRDTLGLVLKQQLRTTPIDRVTVSGLASAARINRQTFYYHFADVYDLAVWVFEQDIANHIMEHASYDQGATGYQSLLQYMADHYDQTKAVLDSIDHRQRDKFFLGQFRAMMRPIVEELQGDLVIRDEDREFVIDHYAAIVLGHFLQWLSDNATEDPATLVPRIERALRGTVRQTLERFSRPQ